MKKFREIIWWICFFGVLKGFTSIVMPPGLRVSEFWSGVAQGVQFWQLLIYEAPGALKIDSRSEAVGYMFGTSCFIAAMVGLFCGAMWLLDRWEKWELS